MRMLLLACCIMLGAIECARACPHTDLEDILSRIDDHLFWAEFWDDSDAGESLRERHYALSEVRRLLDKARDPTCTGDPVAANLERLARRVQTAEDRNVARATGPR